MKTELINDPAMKFAQRQFEQWRSQKKKGERDPEHLWSLALKLTDHHATSSVAKILRLDANHLRRRRKQTRPAKSDRIEVTTLAPIQLAHPPSSTRQSRSSGIIAEITTRTGAHARIFSGLQTSDLEALSHLLQEV
jgi:hypothetical protein